MTYMTWRLVTNVNHMYACSVIYNQLEQHCQQVLMKELSRIKIYVASTTIVASTIINTTSFLNKYYLLFIVHSYQ